MMTNIKNLKTDNHAKRCKIEFFTREHFTEIKLPFCKEFVIRSVNVLSDNNSIFENLYLPECKKISMTNVFVYKLYAPKCEELILHNEFLSKKHHVAIFCPKLVNLDIRGYIFESRNLHPRSLRIINCVFDVFNLYKVDNLSVVSSNFKRVYVEKIVRNAHFYEVTCDEIFIETCWKIFSKCTCLSIFVRKIHNEELISHFINNERFIDIKKNIDYRLQRKYFNKWRNF